MRLPLFPLNVVLFPGTPLPLHIFEPRYRQMLADCLEGDRRFGMTQPGAESEAPAPGAVGCVAKVRVNQELPDGTSNIVVLGEERFVVARLLEGGTPYLLGVVETFEDESATTPDPARVERLREHFTRYAALIRELSDVEPEAPDLPADPVELSFQVAAALELDVALKQRLLAERSTARRVDVLLLALPALITTVERALVVHRRAHGNGRGHSQPSLPTA